MPPSGISCRPMPTGTTYCRTPGLARSLHTFLASRPKGGFSFVSKFAKFMFVGLTAVLFLVAGCGGSKQAAAPADPVLKSMLETGVLQVGVDATFAPFEYVENGQKTGFDIELVTELAKVMGAKKVEWVDLDFKGLIPGLQAKRFDVIASAMYITEERRKAIDFSDAYYPGGLVVMVKADNKSISGPDDLKGKSVAVQTGTKSVTFLKEKYPEAKLVEVEKNAEMFAQVETGRTDAAVTGKPAAKVYAQKRPGVKVLEKQLTVEEYGFGVRKENPDLVKAINAGLKKLKENGTYQKLIDKWFEGK